MLSRVHSFAFALLGWMLAGLACESSPASQAQDLGAIVQPVGFPAPTMPPRGWPSVERVELGRALFYEPRLSGNQTQSCASCHQQARGFAEPLPTSLGSTGQVSTRNASSLVNVVYNSTLTWAHPHLTQLEDQIVIPLFGDAPVEMNASANAQQILQLLAQDPRYQQWFAKAYPTSAEPVTWDHIIWALADFVRTLISSNSAFDRFVYHQEYDAMSASALRGMELFFSERLECHHCHGGFNFSASTTHDNSTERVLRFHNVGLYNLDGQGAYPPEDPGLFAITGRPEDMGRFRAPTLRNVAVSGPYMHDGSLASLDEVLRFYEAGGRVIHEGPLAGDGRASPLKSGFVVGFSLTDAERADLIAFLHSLTDPQFLSNPAFSDPHAGPQ